MKSACPVCGSLRRQPLYEAVRQPVLLNRLFESRQAALDAPSVNLDFRGCLECGFVWNAAFDRKLTRYGREYFNDQSRSAVFRTHLEETARRLAAVLDGVEGSIIEIGCGQGSFLQEMCRRCDRRGIGFDPACSRREVADDRVLLVADSFDESAVSTIEDRGSIALVIARHVLEHVPDPVAMLRVIFRVLPKHRHAQLFLEVPMFEWIGREGAFFDLFNEHCSLFDTASLERALDEAGFVSSSIDKGFNGQYLAALAHARSDSASPPRRVEQSRDFAACRQALADARAEAVALLDESLGRPVVVWGAGAKGVSFVNHLAISWRDLPFLVDINPNKQGRFVPLTGQEVIAPQDIARRLGTRLRVIVMNAAYLGEIQQRLADLGIDAVIETATGSLGREVHR